MNICPVVPLPFEDQLSTQAHQTSLRKKKKMPIQKPQEGRLVTIGSDTHMDYYLIGVAIEWW